MAAPQVVAPTQRVEYSKQFPGLAPLTPRQAAPRSSNPQRVRPAVCEPEKATDRRISKRSSSYDPGRVRITYAEVVRQAVRAEERPQTARRAREEVKNYVEEAKNYAALAKAAEDARSVEGQRGRSTSAQPQPAVMDKATDRPQSRCRGKSADERQQPRNPRVSFDGESAEQPGNNRGKSTDVHTPRKHRVSSGGESSLKPMKRASSVKSMPTKHWVVKTTSSTEATQVFGGGQQPCMEQKEEVVSETGAQIAEPRAHIAESWDWPLSRKEKEEFVSILDDNLAADDADKIQTMQIKIAKLQWENERLKKEAAEKRAAEVQKGDGP